MLRIERRNWLRAAGLGLLGASSSGWLPNFAHAAAADPRRKRHCILLWMSGGPAQTDTFDLKPQHENGGEFKEIATSAPGVRFSEHLPQLARHADKLAIVRSLSTKEGDHQRGTHLMRTGHAPTGMLRYPSIGAALAKELTEPDAALPPYVTVSPQVALAREAYGPGFLGPKYAPLIVGGASGMTAADAGEGFSELRVDSVRPPAGVSDSRMAKRRELWRALESGFVDSHASAAPRAHQTVYQNALRMIDSNASKAFNLSEEPDAVRERYGRGTFGQGCLLARRLVEQGVPFVEVTLPGWDTHSDNFNAVERLSAELDAGWATLMTELEDRGLLESTTVLWMGEFGRTPQINGGAGRDHFPRAWSCVLGGGGIAGGQAYGRTSRDGMQIEDDPVGAPEVLATLASAVGVSPWTENLADSGRPIKLVEAAPIDRLLSETA